MPCFEAAAHVGAAIDSVVAQSWPAIEIVVVDDGSRDGSADLVERRYGDRVTLVRQANAGAAAARNAAFARATGDFVLFMDADDLIAPGHVEALVQRLGGAQDAVAFSNWDRFYRDPAEARFPRRPWQTDMDGIDWLVAHWTAGLTMTQPGMFLIPRGVVERRGGWDTSLSLNDDFEFFARILSAARMRFAPGGGLYYRSGLSTNLASQKRRRHVESALDSLLKGTSQVIAVRDDAASRRACANVLMGFVYDQYPYHPDLRARAMRSVAELGGAACEPVGPPGFHALRRFVGWRAARLAQIGGDILRGRRPLVLPREARGA